MLTVPFRYQRAGAIEIQRFGGRALVADDMGVGKSLQALLWAYRHPEQAWPMLIICPAGLKWNWARECQKHLGWRSLILEGTKPHPIKPHKHQAVIINYDILHKWMEELVALYPQLVICDEVHYVKSLRSRRTKKTRYLCRQAPYVIGLSGTPLTSRPAELWPFLNMVRPDKFPSFYSFASKFCDIKRTPWGITWTGATKLPELNKLLRSTVMIRRLKKDVLQGLPPKSRYVVPLEVSKPKEYQKAKNDFLTWLRRISKSKARRAAKAQTITKIMTLKRLAAELKMPAALEWLDNWLEDSDGKIIVFGIHKKILQMVKERHRGISIVVDGSVTGKKRQDAYDYFTANKKCRMLIGNIQAAGVGWNGTVAKHVSFLELPWNPSEAIQAEDRIHRIGSDEPVFCWYLPAVDTIEESLCSILQEKQKIVSAVLDGEDTEDLNIYDELIAKLEEEK